LPAGVVDGGWRVDVTAVGETIGQLRAASRITYHGRLKVGSLFRSRWQMTYQLYWGDLHSHCSISYGEGTVAQALARARRQLDFCSITGHAFWPDMPVDRQQYGDIIDYHNEGFARLAKNWDRLLAEQAAGSRSDTFLALPSYEWHSLKYGDHNVYAAGPELPLLSAPDLPALREVARAASAIVIPHHIGYAAGYRGIDWEYFDAGLSPFVEIYSLHGCSESEEAPYPMLHDMGPRDWQSTASAGWANGHRFGVIASTDHHGGYPGSHGDGRVGVWASNLTREAIWEAFLARRVYAVTGDKIEARMLVDGAEMGGEIESTAGRRIELDVRGSDAVDCVEILKNDVVLKRLHPHLFDPGEIDRRGQQRFRLRITWGWGRKNESVPWSFDLALGDGAINAVETCFSGQAIVAPKGVGGHQTDADEQDLPHEVLEQQTRQLGWRSVTTGNLSMRHGTTQALSIELDGRLSDRLTLVANGATIQYTLGDLLRRGRSHYLRGWLSEAVRIGPLIPEEDCRVKAAFEDAPGGSDRYRARVRQVNGQWAWLSPIWVDQ
jgi:hypothetical protein